MHQQPVKYIYDLPHAQRKILCRILDQNNKWEELGGTHMKYDLLTIQDLKREVYRGNSPTDELLTLWGQQNHTVLELFMLLNRMRHYQAMTVLKEFVDAEYHRHIYEGQRSVNRLLRNVSIAGSPSERRDANFNGVAEKKILNAPPAACVSNENNESVDKAAPSKPMGMTDISCVASSAGSIPHIPYEELQRSTNNWSPATVLGKGGFGTVFKGTWKCTQVAVKRIELKEDNPEAHEEQIRQSVTELRWLNAYRHDNVLPLYGYSVGGPQPCLVYQYMPGGSLEHRLRTRDPAKVLKWAARLSIAVGTARGLQFLHTIAEKPIVHGDIKSANILLDPNDSPRIGDFGLAREGPQSDYTHIKVSRIHGTRPYLPDEFLRAKKFSTKVDTYSFGVVLFEIATALGAYSEQREEKFLKDHVVNYAGDPLSLKDPRAEGGEAIFRSLIEIGKNCVDKKAKDRPEMVSVLLRLEAAAN